MVGTCFLRTGMKSERQELCKGHLSGPGHVFCKWVSDLSFEGRRVIFKYMKKSNTYVLVMDNKVEIILVPKERSLWME